MTVRFFNQPSVHVSSSIAKFVEKDSVPNNKHDLQHPIQNGSVELAFKIFISISKNFSKNYMTMNVFYSFGKILLSVWVMTQVYFKAFFPDESALCWTTMWRVMIVVIGVIPRNTFLLQKLKASILNDRIFGPFLKPLDW